MQKKAKLTNNQFYFDARHPYANAKKKLPCLKRLPELTNDMVCILKEMQTVTIVYKLSVTNLEFTLGLTENIDMHGKKVNNFFLPMSLRVEDTSVEKSNDGEIVDFIFTKDASIEKYDTLLVKDKNKMIPESVRHLLDEKLYSIEEDENLIIAWEHHLTAIHENIDRYISSHYRPPYVEHDLALEDECDEEALIVYTSIGEIPENIDITECRCLSVEKDTSLLLDNMSIEDFLRQQGETFSQMLLRLIDERNLKDSQVYRDANIDRRLFSKIRGDDDYIPSKKTVICFCMALQLNLSEAGKLLEAAGYALSTSSRFDLIIMYLLENKEYNVVFANIVLEKYGENALTR